MHKRIAIVTVTYGDRTKFLREVLESVVDDDLLTHFVIVDNASANKEDMAKMAERSHKVEVLRMESNTGSAGGFAKGLEYARALPCDFILLLDDDNTLEEGALKMYMDDYEQLVGKRVVCGWRKDIQDDSVFRLPPDATKIEKTFFNVWKIEKFTGFLKRVFNSKAEAGRDSLYPIVPTKGFVYGGALLPIDAVREAPLPDKDLVLYGDDVEYSWGVLDAGYTAYLCHRPIIRDIDMTFEGGDHILGLFNPKTNLFKVYYRIRNMVRISLRRSSQNGFALHSSIWIWITGLILLGLFRFGLTKNTLMRIKTIIQAVYGGYYPEVPIPHEARLPS